MNKLITIILILFCFVSVSQNSITEKLIKSYKRGNIDLYDKTLKEWSQAIQPWSDDTLSKNELLQDINSIIILLYSQENFELINLSSTWGKGLTFQSKENYYLYSTPEIIIKYTTSSFRFDTLERFKKLRFVCHDSLGKSALYQSLKYEYFDTLHISHIDTIKNARPQILFANKNILLMSENIQKELFGFMYSKKGIKKKRWQYFYSDIYIVEP